MSTALKRTILGVVIFVSVFALAFFLDYLMPPSSARNAPAPPSAPPPSSSSEDTSYRNAVIEKAVIYNEEDVAVTVTGMEYVSNAPEINFSVKNSSDSTVSIFSTDAYVNNYLVETFFHMKVKPGETKEGSMSFDYQELTRYGITAFGRIEFCLWRQNERDEPGIVYRTPIVLETSLVKDAAIGKPFPGIVLVDQDDVKISYIELTHIDGLQVLLLQIENNSDLPFQAKFQKSVINGEINEASLYGSYQSEVVAPGKIALSGLRVSYLDVPDDWDYNHMEIAFHCSFREFGADYDNYSFETGLIPVDLLSVGPKE